MICYLFLFFSFHLSAQIVTTIHDISNQSDISSASYFYPHQHNPILSIINNGKKIQDKAFLMFQREINDYEPPPTQTHDPDSENASMDEAAPEEAVEIERKPSKSRLNDFSPSSNLFGKPGM